MCRIKGNVQTTQSLCEKCNWFIKWHNGDGHNVDITVMSALKWSRLVKDDVGCPQISDQDIKPMVAVHKRPRHIQDNGSGTQQGDQDVPQKMAVHNRVIKAFRNKWWPTTWWSKQMSKNNGCGPGKGNQDVSKQWRHHRSTRWSRHEENKTNACVYLYMYCGPLLSYISKFYVSDFGFFPACKDFGRMFDHSFLTCAFYFFLIFFFNSFCLFVFCFLLKWRLARAHKFHSSCQDQSTVTQRAETTVAESSLTGWVWARFRIGSHTTPT